MRSSQKGQIMCNQGSNSLNICGCQVRVNVIAQALLGPLCPAWYKLNTCSIIPCELQFLTRGMSGIQGILQRHLPAPHNKLGEPCGPMTHPCPTEPIPLYIRAHRASIPCVLFRVSTYEPSPSSGSRVPYVTSIAPQNLEGKPNHH